GNRPTHTRPAQWNPVAAKAKAPRFKLRDHTDFAAFAYLCVVRRLIMRHAIRLDPAGAARPRETVLRQRGSFRARRPEYPRFLRPGSWALRLHVRLLLRYRRPKE